MTDAPAADTDASPGLLDSAIDSLPLVHRGKVRDVYAVDEGRLLIVASDRASAFDVILPTPIPGKGKLLTRIALFWFERLAGIVPNHLADMPLEEVLPDPAERARAEGRSMIVRRLEALPVEAVVRGYLAGSAWKDYRRDGRVCGIELPAALRQAERLPAPIFTPATKAAVGTHDENIDFARMCDIVGRERAEEIRRTSLALYEAGAAHAENAGLIVADTKFEFGCDADGRLVLIDEALTPDSSRFWDADTWRPGASPPSFDKQFLRDWLETLDWDKSAPGPQLPPEIVGGTLARYEEALARLTGASV